jgi:hypothetical protein
MIAWHIADPEGDGQFGFRPAVTEGDDEGIQHALPLSG